jgi:hypothetical protein
MRRAWTTLALAVQQHLRVQQRVQISIARAYSARPNAVRPAIEGLARARGRGRGDRGRRSRGDERARQRRDQPEAGI